MSHWRVVVNVPKFFAVEKDLFEEATSDVAELLVEVLQLFEVVREILFLAEL